MTDNFGRRGEPEVNREPDDVRDTDMNSGPTADRARIERLLLRYAGAALLAATAAIHLDLYLTGYNSIPTIGVLFLFQIIAAFLLAIAVAVTGSRIAAVLGPASRSRPSAVTC